MYSSRGRIIGAALAAVIGIALLAASQPIGWLFLPVPILLLWGYYRYGPMMLAFRAYHDRDWSTLQSHLNTVHRPQWLSPQNRAYFDLLSGVAAYKRGEVGRARELLNSVDPQSLSTDNMRSILECHRAEIALAANDVNAARRHLERARSVPHKPEVASALAELERHLAAV